MAVESSINIWIADTHSLADGAVVIDRDNLVAWLALCAIKTSAVIITVWQVKDAVVAEQVHANRALHTGLVLQSHAALGSQAWQQIEHEDQE